MSVCLGCANLLLFCLPVYVSVLSATLLTCCLWQGVHGTKTTQHALALDYVTVAGVVEKLQANIQEDHQLTCGFLYATWKRVSIHRTYLHGADCC